MEEQEGGQEFLITKSPQEQAAQVLEVYQTSLRYSGHPEGLELDEYYEKGRVFVEKLLETGVSDERLTRELYRLSEDLGERGVLLEKGYAEGLRSWRRNYEEGIKTSFNYFLKRFPFAEAEELEKIAQLRKKVINLNEAESVKLLSESFVGGNFLFHASKVDQVLEILEDGELRNFFALKSKQANEDFKGTNFIKGNSGYEGISWSYNTVGALPGDRYHLAGFLGSPQEVLTQEQQLVIPSRPAPHELVQINGDINSEKYYTIKSQEEMLLQFGWGESNSVLSNMIHLEIFRENSYEEGAMLEDFYQKNFENPSISEKLRSLYSLRKDGSIEFSIDLFQQVANELPVAAVWLQAIIDTGRIKNVKGFENETLVTQIIKKLNKGDIDGFMDEIKKDDKYLENLLKDELEKVTPLSVPISQMYLLIPNTDLEKYLRVIARCQTQPKGILLYDSKLVRLENFASKHRGDNEAMTKELRKAIKPTHGYIDYEKVLGEVITPDKIRGYRRHVISEKFLRKRKSLRKDPSGKLVLT